MHACIVSGYDFLGWSRGGPTMGNQQDEDNHFKKKR